LQTEGHGAILPTTKGSFMVPGPGAPDGYPLSALDQLRHDLKSPLTTIYGRAQLMTRTIQRSPSLSEEERDKLLSGLAVIESSVQRLVSVIDRMNKDQPPDGEDAQQTS
jgi:nitrogen-specific signal transduction histidine kinase